MQAKLPPQIRFSPEEVTVVDTEIQKLLAKNVIERANRVENDFISNIFTRKKRDGTYRLILNLQNLNKAIEYHHFKMETIRSTLCLVKQGCWMASIDLKDAYYSVPIYSTDRKFLKFMWKDQCFQYTCLPNGLSSAPRVFTKLLKPVFSTLRKQGFQNVPYIDDILLLGDSDEHCAQNVRSTSSLLDSLGFTIHPTKSVFMPVQEIAFLCFLINSKKMTVSLLQEKANEIKNLGSKLIIKHEIQIRELAQLIGKMVAASPAVQHAPLRYRNLEIFKDTMLRQNRGDFDKKVLTNVGAIQDISWWCDNICTSSKNILIPTVDIVLETDSSQKGWGGCEIKSGKKTGGNWSYEEKLYHINYLELKAVLLSIKTFCSTSLNTHIQVRLDNMVAMHYINNMGGRIPELNLLA